MRHDEDKMYTVPGKMTRGRCLIKYSKLTHSLHYTGKKIVDIYAKMSKIDTDLLMK